MNRRWIWTVLAVLAVVAFVLRNAGAWLIVDEPLGLSAAIVVLGGGAPFRAMEAADIYQQKIAPEIWLTRGEISSEDRKLEELHVHRTTDYEISQQVLEKLGIPDTAIRLLPDQTPNTAEEVRVVARELRARGGSRAVIVTSSYHTRRARLLWNRLIGKAPAAIVRSTHNDSNDPVHWWRHTLDATFVWREWFGIANVVLGFPMAH